MRSAEPAMNGGGRARGGAERGDPDVGEAEIDIRHLLEAMVNLGASDLHLTVGAPPMYRIDGDLKPVNSPPLKPRQTEEMIQALAPPAKRQAFDEWGTTDFSYAIHGVGRYRVNIFHQRGSSSLAIRLVNNRILTIEELGLPATVARIAERRRGLVLVTGVTGSGKTSTLAAMIRHINDTRRAHILTIEDPIEYLHTHNRSIVNQIELGVDAADSRTALKHVLRQDPDVILLGELRDRESVKSALQAAETGHLVFATLPTANTQKTVHRMLHLFEPDEEKLVLQELSTHLRAIVSQRLLRRLDGKGRVAAVEILLNTPRVAQLLMEGRIDDLPHVVESGQDDMVSFRASLAQLVRERSISLEEGLQYADDAAAFRRSVEGPGGTGDGGAFSG